MRQISVGSRRSRRQASCYGSLLTITMLSLLTITPLLADPVRKLQKQAAESKSSNWGHWGPDASKYSSWTSHSNRLVPVYTFGIGLKRYKDANSLYRNAEKIKKLYGYLPTGTVNQRATYLDQTDIYRLQWDAVRQGKKYIILMIFDGMDWDTARAAAVYASGQVYKTGRGSGLSFQDYDGCLTDYGFFVSSPHNQGTNTDVNAQTVINEGGNQRGGYDGLTGGPTPWSSPREHKYLLGKSRRVSHAVTDSASSATSMTTGIKTYNAAINVNPNGKPIEPIARRLQSNRKFAIGVVTSVPISHATPAAAYANNVSRNDYQDLTRDLLGVSSVTHRTNPLNGVDVLIGSGWGEDKDSDKGQGSNYVAGNKYLDNADLTSIDHQQGGRYVVALRTPGKDGTKVLLNAARKAYAEDLRLFGFFGASGGNLPYQTADGEFNPHGLKYSPADVSENPTLADMTRAAIGRLSKNQEGFWLIIEAGDVDWANHDNNIDNSIGSVLSGDAAFRTVVSWVEKRKAWKDTALILTADHGHYLQLVNPLALAPKLPAIAKAAVEE